MWRGARAVPRSSYGESSAITSAAPRALSSACCAATPSAAAARKTSAPTPSAEPTRSAPRRSPRARSPALSLSRGSGRRAAGARARASAPMPPPPPFPDWRCRPARETPRRGRRTCASRRRAVRRACRSRSAPRTSAGTGSDATSRSAHRPRRARVRACPPSPARAGGTPPPPTRQAGHCDPGNAGRERCARPRRGAPPRAGSVRQAPVLQGVLLPLAGALREGPRDGMLTLSTSSLIVMLSLSTSAQERSSHAVLRPPRRPHRSYRARPPQLRLAAAHAARHGHCPRRRGHRPLDQSRALPRDDAALGAAALRDGPFHRRRGDCRCHWPSPHADPRAGRARAGGLFRGGVPGEHPQRPERPRRRGAAAGGVVLLDTLALPAARDLVGALLRAADPLALARAGGRVIGVHLAAAILGLLIGAAVLARKKGTVSHKALGRVWVGLMLVVALSSFWILEIRDGAGFSVIHLLSAWTLVSLALAVYFIRRGNVRAHKGFMIGTFLGLAGAGLGALAPGRALYLFLFA